MDTTTAPANYPQNLNELMSQGNPFLQNMAIAQQQTGQAQAGQNLAATIQSADQQRQMFPLTQQETIARTGQHTANTRLLGSEAAKNEDALRILQSVPTDIRANSLLKEHLSKASESDRKIFADKMMMLQPFAVAAAANKGILPLSLQSQLPKDLAPYFADANTGMKTAQLAKAWLTSTPDYQQATSVANIQGGFTLTAERERSKTLKEINQANIDAGKYANHNIDYLMMKAATSGNYAGQSGLWTQRSQMAKEAASRAEDQDQRNYLLQKAGDYDKLALAARQAGVSQAAAAAYTSLAKAIDPTSFGMQSLNPGGAPIPGNQSPEPANQPGSPNNPIKLK